MGEMIKYCIEYKVKGEFQYRKSFHGFTDREHAIERASKSIRDQIEKVRVVKQTRRVIKVFK